MGDEGGRRRGRALSLQQEAGLTLWQQLDAGGRRAQAQTEFGPFAARQATGQRPRLPLAARLAYGWGFGC